jgi:hypothetical protein
MIKVAMEVQSGAVRIGVTVQAESIERALRLVAGRFPGTNCRVKFPIEPEGFFVAGRAPAGMIESDRLEKVAA